MIYNISIPPDGFNLDYTDKGHPLIRYRTKGMTGPMIFFIIWLSFWTFACVLFTNQALTAPGGIKVGLLLFMIPFWAAEFFVIGYVIWYFGSIISFEFQPDKLIVSRRCLMYRKQRELFKNQITNIRQVKDGGQGEDSFDSWGIIVEADKKYKILYRQQAEKSEWVGRTLEKWSQKKYIPWRDESKDIELI
jgi:hypothetical protein